jgi:DNA-directed RNA polymerase beta subunit
MPDPIRDPRDADADGRIYDGTPQERAVAPSPPTAAPPAGARDFGDAAAVRTAVYDRALKAAQAIEPVTNKRHTLALTDVAYEGPGADFTLAEQKRAILEGRSLGRRLRGTYTLSDAETGQELGRKRTTVAVIPYVTPRGTFVHNGTEYTLAALMRLRSGAYTRRHDNGELSTHLNVLPGQGLSHHVYLEPETGRFKLKIGQAHLPLLPLLRAMGTTDSEVRAAWGNDLAYANARAGDAQTIEKLHARLVRNPDETPAGGRAAAVAAEFARMRLDPEVTRQRRTTATTWRS